MIWCMRCTSWGSSYSFPTLGEKLRDVYLAIFFSLNKQGDRRLNLIRFKALYLCLTVKETLKLCQDIFLRSFIFSAYTQGRPYPNIGQGPRRSQFEEAPELMHIEPRKIKTFPETIISYVQPIDKIKERDAHSAGGPWKTSFFTG